MALDGRLAALLRLKVVADPNIQTPFLKTYMEIDADPQKIADVSVVIPTTMRATLAKSVESVFCQSFKGRINIYVGVDKIQGDTEFLDALARTRPSNVSLYVLYLGYSTSVRHGGLVEAQDGGALRTVLSYLANSPYVAYLDDDNWWKENHLQSLLAAIEGMDWAFSLRWFCDAETREPLAVDEWESLGPGKGVFNQRFGGFVDPSCLMLNKIACASVLPLWQTPLKNDPSGQSSDRTVFEALRRNVRWRGTGLATAFYHLGASDGLHERRMRAITAVRQGEPGRLTSAAPDPS